MVLGGIRNKLNLALPGWGDLHEEIRNFVSILDAEVFEVEKIKNKLEGVARFSGNFHYVIDVEGVEYFSFPDKDANAVQSHWDQAHVLLD